MNSAMAFAFYTAAGKQRLYKLHRSSPAVNEIHAKTMEHFMYPYLKLFIGDQEKEYKCSHLMQQLENLPYRCAIDEFEHLMYDRKLTRVQLCELWADISGKYMPWHNISLEEIHQGICWPRQTHIVETPFYYIQYDIAQMSTYEFYLRMKNNHEQAWSDHTKLCSAGGSKSYLELLKTAALSNPFTGKTLENISITAIQQAVRYMEEHICENISYVDAAKSVHMSSYNFHRTFRFIAGMTANEYIRKRRLTLAAQELQTMDISVIDAAYKYGCRFFTEFVPQTGYTQTEDTDYEIYFEKGESGLFCELWVPVKQI